MRDEEVAPLPLPFPNFPSPPPPSYWFRCFFDPSPSSLQNYLPTIPISNPREQKKRHFSRKPWIGLSNQSSNWSFGLYTPSLPQNSRNCLLRRGIIYYLNSTRETELQHNRVGMGQVSRLPPHFPPIWSGLNQLERKKQNGSNIDVTWRYHMYPICGFHIEIYTLMNHFPKRVHLYI